MPTNASFSLWRAMFLAKVSFALLSIASLADAKRITKSVANSVVNDAAVEVESNSSQQPSSVCAIRGDPHVRTFDTSKHGGPDFHPMHAPGHWWLVKGENNFISIQGTYGGCGYKQGGWMSARLGDVPRTCLTGVAVSGMLLQDSKRVQHTLIIQAPCDWDWDNSRCKNAEKGETPEPRIKWDGAAVESIDETDPLVQLTQKGKKMTVKLPFEVQFDIKFNSFHPYPASYMNLHIKMPQPPASGPKVCGHCGDFNGNAKDDHRYKLDGNLKDATGDAFCDASVHCGERLIDDVQFASFAGKDNASVECVENPPGVNIGTEDCPTPVAEAARHTCEEIFQAKNVKGAPDHHDMEDCILDVCLGGKGFAEHDADEAIDDEADLKAMHG